MRAFYVAAGRPGLQSGWAGMMDAQWAINRKTLLTSLWSQGFLRRRHPAKKGGGLLPIQQL